MTASTSGDSMEEFGRCECLRAGDACGGGLCTFGIDVGDSANLGPRNRFRNRWDVIGSHDSSADNSYAKSVVFGHVLQ